jgi:hypothetical protein
MDGQLLAHGYSQDLACTSNLYIYIVQSDAALDTNVVKKMQGSLRGYSNVMVVFQTTFILLP